MAIVSADSYHASADHIMSYMRGDSYIWSDGHAVHVWLADGDDHGWQESGWAAHYQQEAGTGKPSGIQIPLETLDELVAMRLAQLIEQGQLAAAIDRALEKNRGNGGCYALARLAPALRTSLVRLSSGEE